MEDLQKALDTAKEAAEIAGEILHDNFETSLSPDIKPDKTFVTKVDTESEKSIIETIVRAFPKHAFLGEESGESGEKSDYLWVIDPLDGTSNFINGIPIFSVSIALQYKGETVVAVVYNPVTSSLFYASKDNGAFWNGNPIKVSDETEVNVVTTIGRSRLKEDENKMLSMLSSLHEIGRVRILGSAALELAYLARGGTEVYINLGTKPWDYSAGLLIAEEAGAQVTCLDGSPRGGSNYFVATNGKVHEKVIGITSGV